jgi:hypothetical protein
MTMKLAPLELRRYLIPPCRVTARDVLEMLREIEIGPNSHQLDGPLLMDISEHAEPVVCLSSPIAWSDGYLCIEWEDFGFTEPTPEEKVKLAAGIEHVERWQANARADWERVHGGSK